MTVTQALARGFVLWEDGHGHWAGDGTLQAGPCRSKVKLLGAIESLTQDGLHPSCSVCGEADGCDHLHVEDDKPPGSNSYAAELNIVTQPADRTWATVDPLLCVGCHRLYPSDTQFDQRGRCLQCHSARP